MGFQSFSSPKILSFAAVCAPRAHQSGGGPAPDSHWRISAGEVVPSLHGHSRCRGRVLLTCPWSSTSPSGKLSTGSCPVLVALGCTHRSRGLGTGRSPSLPLLKVFGVSCGCMDRNPSSQSMRGNTPCSLCRRWKGLSRAVPGFAPYWFEG